MELTGLGHLIYGAKPVNLNQAHSVFFAPSQPWEMVSEK
jgi:hypothetical protein